MSGFARGASLAIVVGLTAFLLYAFATGEVIPDQLHVWSVVWGLYVWADAYSGFLLFSLIIYAYERNLTLVVVLFIVTCCTGNMVNAAWLLWRGPDLLRRIQSHSTRISS
ncbi:MULTISPECIES: hypothetical protein [Novosphingobium]|jgi:hypothetical protein|uniref:DUF1475 domain-containing protein n=1 Tax=Novosphingobium resinovorum TaxID=158500 RepID=A0A031K182_9SPHN|nr:MULTISPECIES: hypothetical protein [Novosphingobium]AOR78875.1 hypothetical protein BES08_18350 [Novosphingobium resinovorum]EZP82954.1 hypothetical protein BV97_01878 [Novosphingobium resinovorum]GLK42977.1 hypothetical protein GCM10017612_08940 [Novosphingobium resinovorum]